MTYTQTPGVAAQSRPFMDEHDRQRAVDLIEGAERSAPFCLCGGHMIAVAEGDQIWLECAKAQQHKRGFGGVVARLTAWTHSRRLVMELPTDH